MKNHTRKKKYSASLPPVPIEPSMKEQVVMIAGQEGISVSELVRSSIRFFLAGNYSKAIDKDSLAISSEGQSA